MPNGPAREPERGSVIVRRGWLHQVLREGADAAGVPTTYGARLVSIDEDAHGVRATFADGTVAEGDILVGADGIGSPDAPLDRPGRSRAAYSGLVGVGGFARVPGLEPTPETQHFVFGARSFFGYLVRADGTVYWFANMTSPQPDRGRARRHAASGSRSCATCTATTRSPCPQILADDDGRARRVPDRRPRRRAAVEPRARRRARRRRARHAARAPGRGRRSRWRTRSRSLVRCATRRRPRGGVRRLSRRARQPRADAVVKYARAINAQKRVTKSRLGVAIRDCDDADVPASKAANDTRNDWLYNHRSAETIAR